VFDSVGRGKARPGGGDGSKTGLYNSFVRKIAVGVRNDQMFKGAADKFKSKVSFVIHDYS